VIELTRLSGERFFLNADLIETVEETPDTVIRLTTGRTVLVEESAAEVRERVKAWQRAIRCRRAPAP
jgi:flagellar protein FlbD